MSDLNKEWNSEAKRRKAERKAKREAYERSIGVAAIQLIDRLNFIGEPKEEEAAKKWDGISPTMRKNYLEMYEVFGPGQ